MIFYNFLKYTPKYIYFKSYYILLNQKVRICVCLFFLSSFLNRSHRLFVLVIWREIVVNLLLLSIIAFFFISVFLASITRKSLPKIISFNSRITLPLRWPPLECPCTPGRERLTRSTCGASSRPSCSPPGSPST